MGFPWDQGHWDVCSWPQGSQALSAGSGKAVMDQESCPCQVLPVALDRSFHLCSMLSPWQNENQSPQYWGADCWEKAGSL